MAARNTALIAISIAGARSWSDRLAAIRSPDMTRAVISPGSLWLKNSSGSRSSRETLRSPAATAVRMTRCPRDRCLSQARPYATTAAPASPAATSPPQRSRSTNSPATSTWSTKIIMAAGIVSASRASISPQAAATASSPQPPSSQSLIRRRMEGRSPPGRNCGPVRNCNAMPEYPLPNSSADSVRRPVRGSLMKKRSRSTPSRIRKWLNCQNRMSGSGSVRSSPASAIRPLHSRPYCRAARNTAAAVVPSRLTPHFSRSSRSGTQRPK